MNDSERDSAEDVEHRRLYYFAYQFWLIPGVKWKQTDILHAVYYLIAVCCM